MSRILELADAYAELEGKLASLEEIYTHSRTHAKELRKEIAEARADLADVVQELERDAAKLEYLLSGMFNQYENGTPCYDKPVEGIFIGYAMKLSDEDFDAIVNILNKCEDAAIAAREGGST
jgi:hypothetical protein